MERLLRKNATLAPFTGTWDIGDRPVDVYNVLSWQRGQRGAGNVVMRRNLPGLLSIA